MKYLLLAAVLIVSCKESAVFKEPMAVAVPKNVVPQVTLNGTYKGSALITDEPLTEYTFHKAEMESPYMFGDITHFKPDGSFLSAYSADCGNDCFPACTGRYSWVDEAHIRIIADSITVRGDCENRQYNPHKDLGLYYVLQENDSTIRFIKSNGNAQDDRKRLEWSAAIARFDRETSDIPNFYPIRMQPGNPNDTDIQSVKAALAGNNAFEMANLNVLYSCPIRHYFKVVLFEYKGKQHFVVCMQHSGYAGLYEPDKWPKK
jgi:hypothetical protein